MTHIPGPRARAACIHNCMQAISNSAGTEARRALCHYSGDARILSKQAPSFAHTSKQALAPPQQPASQCPFPDHTWWLGAASHEMACCQGQRVYPLNTHNTWTAIQVTVFPRRLQTIKKHQAATTTTTSMRTMTTMLQGVLSTPHKHVWQCNIASLHSIQRCMPHNT